MKGSPALLLLVALACAHAADAPVSSESIEAALAKPPEMKTRGLKVQARGEEARSEEAHGSIDLQIPFAVNSATLLPAAQAQLKALANALQSPRLAGQHFELAGHTDASGQAERNRALSLARAESVRDFLAQAGVATANLAVTGHGADRPLPGKSPYDSLNRRVEVRTREAP